MAVLPQVSGRISELEEHVSEAHSGTLLGGNRVLVFTNLVVVSPGVTWGPSDDDYPKDSLVLAACWEANDATQEAAATVATNGDVTVTPAGGGSSGNLWVVVGK